MSPSDRPLPEGAGWVAEPKMDGWRALVRVRRDGAVVITSRRGRPLTDRFPEVVGALAGLPPVVLDGELVVCGRNGRPDFHALHRDRRDRAPATLAAFDVLELDGRRVLTEPWKARRGLLEALPLPEAVQPVPVGGVTAMCTATGELGLEGVVAKGIESPYEPGVRSRWWVRRKHWTVSELLVIGYGVNGAGRVVRIFTAPQGAPGVGVVEMAIGREVAAVVAAQDGEHRRDVVWFREPTLRIGVRHHGDPAHPRDAQCQGLVG